MHKIIIRSIFYHWLFLFIGISIGFIANSEWVGYKYAIVQRSIKNIFFPVEYNEEIESFVKEMGQMRTWVALNCPRDFKIIEENVIGQEFYWCKYSVRETIGTAQHRIKWKTWEYYYKIDEPIVK
jgi:hypothetical protein